MLSERRAKIVATIGPATESRENLKKAICSGMNVARLNFSHGTQETHLKVIRHLRDLSEELKAPVSLLQDLQGPKIRVGHFPGGGIELKKGDVVQISPDFKKGTEKEIPTDFQALPQISKAGVRILLDDGLIELKVLEVKGNVVVAEVVYGGFLKDRKGMNIPEVSLPIDCLTEKDLSDLEFGLQQDVDYVALSFVRKGSDMRKLREIVKAQNPRTSIIAKIEMKEALENLKEIIQLSDGVMVARGDLAVEVGQAQLPLVQKRIIKLCNEIGRPVITATQMLDSMVESPRPTRAEITDVANAVLDGSDALMLSAESASGKYPFKCIRTMHDIIVEVERASDNYYKINLSNESMDVAEAIAASASLSALKTDAKVIVCLTTTGRTAKLISQFRPKARIIAVTHVVETLNKLELVWGIQTFSILPYKSTDEALSQIEEVLVNYGLAQKGDKVVLTLGAPVQQRAKTNSIRIFTIGKSSPSFPKDSLPLRCQKREKITG
ncbi:MAG: pyruvate kinase [Bdellovibrio sp.]|nr:MAG: pyruvate kinase [Bdellovibrio sp.]